MEQKISEWEFLEERERKRRRRERWVLLSVFLAWVGLTYWEHSYVRSSSTTPLIPNELFIFGLINLNILLLVFLLFLVFRNLVKLLFEPKSSIRWSHLGRKLVFAFLALILLPTLLLFGIAARYVTHSIDSWFNERIESSQEKALEIARTFYRERSNEILRKGREIAQSLKPVDFETLPTQMKGVREQRGLDAVMILSRDGTVLFQESGLEKVEEPVWSDELKNRAEERNGEVAILDSEDREIVEAIVPVRMNGRTEGWVRIQSIIPPNISAPLAEISTAYEEYKQLQLHKSPIKQGYIVTLLLVTLLILFASTWFGFYVARGITMPIQQLAEGTRKIASGELDVSLETSSEDEVGTLVRSFNQMARELKEKQTEIENANRGLRESNEELERRQHLMETILSHIGTGVIAFREGGELIVFNESAQHLMNLSSNEVLEKRFQVALPSIYQNVLEQMMEEAKKRGLNPLIRQVELSHNGQGKTLLVSLSELKPKGADRLGWVVVFEDLTELIHAQRAAAWREVARYVAHEIKNPLTPIQLSAQRLRRRYLARLESPEVLDSCTDTIIQQVDELKRLVDQFSQFARLPQAVLSTHDLNEIIKEVVPLYKEGHRELHFRLELDPELPPLELDEGQMRQVLINLLENAVAATEAGGEITIRTTLSSDAVRLEIRDTGCGIDPEFQERLFEPYFSTKKGGSGLGLAMVQRVVQEHKARIWVEENVPKGSVFIIEFPSEPSSLLAVGV